MMMMMMIRLSLSPDDGEFCDGEDATRQKSSGRRRRMTRRTQIFLSAGAATSDVVFASGGRAQKRIQCQRQMSFRMQPL